MGDNSERDRDNVVEPFKSLTINLEQAFPTLYSTPGHDSTIDNPYSRFNVSLSQSNCLLQSIDSSNPLPWLPNLHEKFAYNFYHLELEHIKNFTSLKALCAFCDHKINKFKDAEKADFLPNLEPLYEHLKVIKTRLESDISILKCERSLLDSSHSSNINFFGLGSPDYKADINYSNSLPSNEQPVNYDNTEGIHSDPEDSAPFPKFIKQSTKGELIKSATPIDHIDFDPKGEEHFIINKHNALMNTFGFISDLLSIGVCTIRLVKGDDVNELEKGESPLTYLDPSFQTISETQDTILTYDNKKRFVLRVRKEAFDEEFLSNLPLKTKLKIELQGHFERFCETSDLPIKNFEPSSFSNILYLDTVDFATVLSLLPRHTDITQCGEVKTLKISPFDIFINTFPSFEHVEISIYLPYLPANYSKTYFQLKDKYLAEKVYCFVSDRYKMLYKTLKIEAMAYRKQVRLCRRARILAKATSKLKGLQDIFEWGCLPVRAIDCPDQYVPLPAGYCYGDKNYPYTSTPTYPSQSNNVNKSKSNDDMKEGIAERNVWMQSSYFNLTGPPLHWHDSAIKELGFNRRIEDPISGNTRSKREKPRRDQHNASNASLKPQANDSTGDYPIDKLNCRIGEKFILYRHLYRLDNTIKVGNTFLRDDDPLFTYYEKNIRCVWTFAEVRMFITKYLLYPKYFYKIASFFDHKTPGDCIDFYYKYKYKLNLKKRLNDVRMRPSSAIISKYKQDIKRHQKRDFHLIDTLFTNETSFNSLYSPFRWPTEFNFKYDYLACADGIISRQHPIEPKQPKYDPLDWRALYPGVRHLENLREGYFLPTDLTSIFIKQPLILPTSLLPTSPKVVTIRGSIHLNKDEAKSADPANFAVCYALSCLARVWSPEPSISTDRSNTVPVNTTPY